MATRKPNAELEKIYKKYGVQGKTTSNDSDKAKQSNSASATRTNDSVKQKQDTELEKIYKKYGVTGAKETTKSSSTISGGTIDKIVKGTVDGVKNATSTMPKQNKTSTGNTPTISFATESKNAYTKYKNGKTTTITSDLTEEERKARIKEINSEMFTIDKALSGLNRASTYMGKTEYDKQVKVYQDKLTSLKAELKSLERVGTFSDEEMLQFEIEDAKQERATAQNKVRSYGSRPAMSAVNEYGMDVKSSVEAQNELDKLNIKKELYKDIEKFGDVVNEDTFGGQWKANYRSGELYIEKAKAFSRYLDNPTEENREVAMAYDALVNQYAQNNEKALDEEGQVFSLLSKNLAGYLPQMLDQGPYELIGGGIGYLAGLTTDPKLGATIGATIGSSVNSYNTIRGAVFSELLSYGVDEETARKMANDEAVISSAIESGETAIDWALTLYGGTQGAGIAALKKPALKAVKNAGKKGLGFLLDAGKATVINSAQEYGEEFSQGSVSRATREKAYALLDKEIGQYGEGNIDLYNRPTYTNADGTISTVDSVTIQIDDEFVLLPSIVRDENGTPIRLEDTEDIVAHYEKTGEYLGKFATLEEANIYANKLHYAQAYKYSENTSVDADDSTLVGSAKVLWDAFFGGNTDALQELHEQGWEGAKTGFVGGTTRTIARNIVFGYSNAKTTKQQNEYADAVIANEKSLNALIEAGKATGEGTVSAEIAEKVEQAKAKGKVTREQVKQLIASNEVYIEAEQKTNTNPQQTTTEPDTIEQAARDVVASKNKMNGFELLEARKRGEVTAEILDTLSQANVEITAEEVKKVTGFGEEGAKIVADYTNEDGATFSQVVRMVTSSYMTGTKQPDLDIKKVAHTFQWQAQADAYTAGQKDRVMQNLSAKENAKNVVVNEESGFSAEGLPSDVTESQIETLDLMAKSVGVKSYVKKGLKGNAELNRAKGEVPIDFDFEREIGEGDDRQSVSIVFHAAHEMAMHRVVELAPEEGTAFVYALYNHLAGNESLLVSTLADQKRSAYAEQGVDISLADAMEEVSANNILTLYNGDEAKFHKAIERIANGKNEKAKQGLKKYIDFLNTIIRKIREVLSGKSAEERAKIQEELNEIAKLRDMFESAFAKAVENRKAMQSKATDTKSAKNLEIKTNQDYNGNINHSLKWHTDLSATQIKQVEKWLRQVGNPEATRITDTTNWYKGRIGGRDLFVIYSTVYDNPTILYEVRGGNAVVERNILLEVLEEIENGESINGKSAYVNWVSGGGWMQKGNNIQNNRRNVGSGQNNQNAGVLPGQSQRNGSPAFWSVLRYIFARQAEAEAENRNDIKHSLKDISYTKAVKKGDMETAQRMVDKAAKKAGAITDKSGNAKHYYHGTIDNFNSFEAEKSRRGTYGFGFYFANHKGLAQNFANYQSKKNDRPATIKDVYIMTSKLATRNDHKITAEQVSRFAQMYGLKLNKNTFGYTDSIEEWVSNANDSSILVSLQEYVQKQSDYDTKTLLKDLSKVFGYDGIKDSDETVLWDNRLVKLADPVTYDDNSNVIPLSKRFDTKKNDDTRYSLKDSDHLKAVESGDMETAQRMVAEAAEKAFSNSKVRGNDGKLKMVYHGRVSDFNVFDRSFARIDGDFGKGYYFSSNEYDVDANYANEEGPDLKNKVARMAERLEWEDEYSDLSYEEREEIAKQRLITSEPSTITAYLNMENPVYINPNKNGTFLDFEEEYNEEYDEYGEPQGLLIDFVEALNRIASDYAYNDVDFNFLYEYAYGNGGVHASDAVKTIKHRITDELTDDNGDLAVNEVIRLAFEEIGFDGIIDTSVYYKFRNMNGMDLGTTHYIVFNSNQIKSADAVTYDDKGNVIPLSQRFNEENDDIRYSLKIEDAINQSMTMEQAKDMIQRAFVIGEIKEWFDGEYKNGDEWLRGEGADAVAMVVENEWTLQQKFLDKIQGLIDEEYYVADIIEAYEKGTLTGKVKQNVVKRLDTTKPTNAKDTRVFAPKDIQNAQEIYKVALERVTNSNREKVYQARADIIMFAHNRGAAEALGLTQSELNKKLSTWASYTARAKEVSMRINKDVALFNKWTGIENSNLLNRATVSQTELDNLVNDVKGDSDGWQRNYIMRTMLALDTHIDYSELNFEFVGTPKTTFGKSVNGFYDNSNRKITVKYNAPHTVSHEMGHFLDYQWARDLGCSGALTDGFSRDKQTDADVKQFLTNFDEFIEQIENSADLRSEYTMNRKEVFARFVAKFVQWVDLVANGKRSYPQEYLSYNDKFTTSQYVEFVRLLQEKSMLDSKDFGNKNVSLKDSGKNDVPGINYSLKGTNNINTKDRKELLDIIEHLKGEFELTKFAKADPKKLTKLTKDLLKEYNSKADFDETRSAIDELYTYMANGENGHTAVWEDVYSRAYKVAQNIVENSLVVDDFYYQQYKSLRDYLRGTPIKFDARHDSVPSSYENYNEFRKMNTGRLKFTNDGMSIDHIYQELSTLYPEFFNAEEEITSEAQFEQILNVLDQIQPTEINPFDSQIEQVSMQLANDITSRFFDLPQAKPTFADKAERRVVAERIKSGKKVEAVKQQKDARIKKLMESQKAKTKKQLDKLREQRDEKVKKEQEKRRDAISKMSENQKVKVFRARILRHTSDLSKKLVNPTDNQHIPYELQGAVAKLLESINLESNYTYDVESGSYKKNDDGLPTKRTQAFNELKKIYSEMSASVVVDPDLLGENGWLSDVISLADKRIADMNSSELDTIWQAIRAIEASISTANKIFSQGKFATILEYAESLREDNSNKKERTEFKGVLGKGKNLATLDMLTPETYFHYLGSAGDSMFRMMRDAQDKHISIMKEVADFTHKTLKGVDVNSLEKTMHTVKLGGVDVKLTTAQLMELFVLMKRDQAQEHILIGGILPDITNGKGLKLNTKAEPIRNISMGEISKALSNLTDEQKKIADEMQKYVSTVLSEYGNEASMKVYNYEKFLEKNYWTIRTNKQEINSEVGKDTSVTSVANKGMAKGTIPHANTSVRIGSIFDTFSSHSSDMATYAAWLGTSEDVNRIRNFVFWENGARTGTVKGILDTVHGLKGSDYLQKLLTDVAIGVKGTDNMNPFDKLVGGYKAASVGANLRVLVQQPTAILRAMDMIGAHFLAEGAVKPLNGWKKAKKYAPIAQWKDWGHFDINTGRQMKDVLFDNASLLEKTKQVSMWGASKMDSLAWGQLWNAVEMETRAKHKGLEVGSEEYYQTVAKRFTEIVDHTQVVDGILQRSQIMRSPDALTKMATSFMGEPTKQYNMAVAAAYDVKNSKGDVRKKAIARLGRTAVSLAVAGIVNACVQSIIDGLRDDDKEKEYWEKWLAAFVGYGEDDKFIDSNLANTINPLTYVPFAKDIVSIMQGYDVKRMDTEAITKTFNAITNMYKAVTGTGKYTIAEASAQLFAEASRLYGLPVANVKRDIKSIVMTVATETDSYVMQYRMEKAMLNINFAGNSKNFMDILFNAYNNDTEAYNIIYDDMLKSGYDADKIQSGMETRMKKAEGVEKSSDLSKRYMSPDVEKKYDSSLNKVKASKVWKSANATQRKEAEADLYTYLTSDSEDMVKARAEARLYGVDETEYALWQLAIEMADQPTGQKGSGNYDYAEKAEAINSLNLGDREMAYFFGKGLNETSKEEIEEVLDAGIDMKEYVNFKAATSEMKADKNAKGNSIPNSKKKKVVKYLNNAGLTDEEWEYFYYEIMNYKK